VVAEATGSVHPLPVLDCGICKSSHVGLSDQSFSIHTKVDVTPKYNSNYRMSSRQELFLKDLMLHLQSRGVVKPCVSPWNSPVLLVPKKDSSHFTVDYSTGVNASTENDTHPLPLIRPLLSEMASFRFFSKLDLTNGYWHLPAADDATKNLTVFEVPGLGQFRWTRLAQGLKHSPSIFQRFMDSILGPYRDWAHAYIDDTIIGTDTAEELDTRLHLILA
jgi:hypothetical protein